MNNIVFVLKNLKNIIEGMYFFVSRKSGSYIHSERGIKILFSKKDDWEPYIRKNFRYSQHELKFEIINEENIPQYDLIVPLTTPDIKYLNSVRHLIINNPIPIPSAESVCLCEDKLLFNKMLIENNFGKYVPRISDKLSYPYILKKRVDQFGANSYIVLNKQQEDELMSMLTIQDYFSQELISSEYEYATHILFSNRKIIHSVNIRYSFEKDIFILGKDKIKYRRKVSQSPYLDIFSSILKFIGFEGLCCFDYKVVNGIPLIFEINPRFGGSLCYHFFSFMKYISWNGGKN